MPVSPTSSVKSRMEEVLAARKEAGSFRTLKKKSSLIDFCSNDYLGFAASPLLKSKTEQKLSLHGAAGSTGSRLISGNSEFAELLEKQIAAFHQAGAGLLFNSGYDANLGLLSCIASRGDTILYDSLVHASMRDGIRLSKAGAFAFQHNNTEHLGERLRMADKSGHIFVAVESVYSMDGDFCPLVSINDLCRRYGANLIVDEAHAGGVFGQKGEGLVSCFPGMAEEVFARVFTFGKALGCHGAIVLGSAVLRDWLINYSRSFIYTTALPPSSLAAISAAYELLQESRETIELLKEQIILFRKGAAALNIRGLIQSDSPIQGLIVPGNKQALEMSAMLAKEGFDVKAILSPTVESGKERLRICIHSYNTREQISDLTKTLGKIRIN